MYDILSQRWANTYDGYEVEMVSLQSDSTAVSQASQTVTWDQDLDTRTLVRDLMNSGTDR